MEVAIIQSADHILNSFDLSIRSRVAPLHCACSLSNILSMGIDASQLRLRFPLSFYIPSPFFHPHSLSPHPSKQQIRGGFYGKVQVKDF